MSKDQFKRFQRAVARRGFFASSWFINKLSYSGLQFVSHIFMAIGYVFVVRHKRVALESLNIAFKGEKDQKEIKQIFKRCFKNVGQGMLDMMYFMDHPRMIKEKADFQGKEHLDAALALGKGVIAVSAHFGNFPLMLLRLAQEGYKTNAIIRRTRDEVLEEHFQKLRTNAGLNTVYAHPRKQCVDISLKVLRDNEILFIPLDQHFGSKGGVMVDFFGQKAATATGPTVFAKRTQAVILPMFIIRQQDDTYKIIIEPPMPLEQRQDEQEMLVANTAKITEKIEYYIRKYPHEWGWMHRRWKNNQSQ